MSETCAVQWGGVTYTGIPEVMIEYFKQRIGYEPKMSKVVEITPLDTKLMVAHREAWKALKRIERYKYDMMNEIAERKWNAEQALLVENDTRLMHKAIAAQHLCDTVIIVTAENVDDATDNFTLQCMDPKAKPDELKAKGPAGSFKPGDMAIRLLGEVSKSYLNIWVPRTHLLPMTTLPFIRDIKKVEIMVRETLPFPRGVTSIVMSYASYTVGMCVSDEIDIRLPGRVKAEPYHNPIKSFDAWLELEGKGHLVSWHPDAEI